jgi:hypothetical protein
MTALTSVAMLCDGSAALPEDRRDQSSLLKSK